jgi:hypothetical protein
MVGTPASQQASKPACFFLSLASVGSILQGLCFFPPFSPDLLLATQNKSQGEHYYPLKGISI